MYVEGLSVKVLYEKDGGRAKDLDKLTTQKSIQNTTAIIIRYTAYTRSTKTQIYKYGLPEEQLRANNLGECKLRVQATYAPLKQ